ncbi:response regulator [Paenibacillus sp. J5C_2022]|uniref:HD domain-containing phosphohydrolase n=1 Tax=Paenibacillus sp. J5C2022 TaxID=2977129 RepID=UPI0021D17879|nr:HD domain-containing phosphohydrolase [Paenibacillus sp. J5C2022]MCU6709615.1 response regulator [Paenibacillus sp. J5C2022]
MGKETDGMELAAPLTDARILMIDDQEYNISLLERMLRRASFHRLSSTTDSLQAERLLLEFDPDIVLLDMHMPGMDGMGVLEKIRHMTGDKHYLPVLMLTADVTAATKQAALQAGANDFLTKPLDRTEVILRMSNLLKTRFLHKQLQHYSETLEAKVAERTKELERAKLEILDLLGRTSEYRDDMTGQHTQRVGRLSELIALELGLPQEHAAMIAKAAPLHDIGKIGISDQLLLKPGRYEPHEFEAMRKHTIIGADILEGSSFDVLKMASIIARWHHEKWDGSGYPDGLAGERIPIEARIVALADFYDALTHDRPYKRAWTAEEALGEVKRQSGKHFDPDIAEVFVTLIERDL